MPWVLLRVGCPGSPQAHTRILPIAQHFKINSTCRGKTKPFDVTLEMRKHKQKRLHSSKLPELKPIGLCFSLPVWRLTAPPSPAGRLPAPPASRWVWALQQPQLHPSACWEKRGVFTHRESLSTFLSSCRSLCVLLFFFFLIFSYLIIFVILDEVAGFRSTSLHEQAAALRDFTWHSEVTELPLWLNVLFNGW